MMFQRALTFGALITLLAACSADQIPGKRDMVRVTYACAEGRSFVANFQRGAEMVEIETDGGTFKLTQVPGLSGDYRFSDDTSTLQARNRWAVLETPGAEYDNCVVQDWEDSVPGIVEGQATDEGDGAPETPMGETPAPAQ